MLRLDVAFVANGISPRRRSLLRLNLVRSRTIRRVNLRDSRMFKSTGDSSFIANMNQSSAGKKMGGKKHQCSRMPAFFTAHLFAEIAVLESAPNS